MAISDRINEMYTHVGEVYDTITNVDLPTNKNIQNIPSTMRSSYLEIMNNGIDKIWNNWEKVTGEGETLTLNSTEEAPMKINLKGNTSQEGTPTPEAPQDIHVVSGDNSIDVVGKNMFDGGGTTTTNGITFTKHSDGSYDIVGTATGPAYILNYVPLAESGIVNGETYTISTNQNITGLEIRIESYNGNTWLRATLGGLITFPKTHSADVTGATSVRFGLFVNSGTTINLKNLKIQLEKGTNATEYEPHQSASYPINLGVENLLQNNLTSGTNNGITYVVNEDKSVTLNGTATAITWLILNSSVTLEAGTYTMTSGYSGNDVRVYSTGLGVYTLNGQRTVTKTSSVSGDVAINIPSGTICNNLTIKPMIEKGSKANSYTPYGTTPIELCKIGDYQDSIKKSSGKNLFNANEVQIGMAWNNTNNSARAVIIIPVEQNIAYTISMSGNNSMEGIYVSYSAKTLAENATNGVGLSLITSFPRTYTSSTEYIILQFNKSSISLSDIENLKLQVEKGQATEYEPYGKVWYLNKQIGKVAFSDLVFNEIGGNFSQFSTNGNIAMVYLQNDLKVTGNRDDVFCNLLKPYSSSLFGGLQTGINQYYNATKLLLSVPLANVEEFAGETLTVNNYLSYTQNYIKGLEGYIYYILATPTYTEITDSTLISQLEAVKRSFNGQTNISQENNDKPFILDVTALKQLTQ